MDENTEVEVERKYDVDPGVLLPDLVGLAGVSGVEPPVEVSQRVTYFDTHDLRLLAAGITLRRRNGGRDDGWRLELPDEGGRCVELRAAVVAPDRPPQVLYDRVLGYIRGRRLLPSAEIVTHRVVHRMVGDQSAVLAEVSDDRVTATSSGSVVLDEWRQWEVELVDGPSELLDVVDKALLSMGARRATASSRAARLLAERLPARPTWQEKQSLDGNPTARDLLTAYLANHFARLVQQDQLLRAGDQESVHQLRVAARRMRSALAAYAPTLEAGATTDLRADLKWFGGMLSDARDAQVLRERLGALVAEQPAELVQGPLGTRIDAELGSRPRLDQILADDALRGDRYFRLLDALEQFLEAPPVTRTADDDARSVVPRLLQGDLDRLRGRHRAYRKATPGPDRDLALHEVRKAAKRLRYLAETAEPVFGERARKLAARTEAVQELLGEHQDSVLARMALLEMSVRMHEAGENAFTLGRLHAIEEMRADDLRRRYRHAFARLPRKNLGAWLTK